MLTIHHTNNYESEKYLDNLRDYIVEIYSRYYPDVKDNLNHNLSAFISEILVETEPRMLFTSRLTGDGLPLELSFTSANTDVRYIIDFVNAPNYLARVEYIKKFLDGRMISYERSIIDQQVERQRQIRSKIKYGAWLGCRHTSTTDNYKIYMEANTEDVPQKDYIQEYFRQYGKLRMLGIPLHGGNTEYYYRCHSLEPWHINKICHELDFTMDGKYINDKIAEACGFIIKENYPASNIGLSIILEEGKLLSLSILFFANSIFGSDSRARKQLLKLAERNSWDFSCYEHMSRPLSVRNTVNTYHSMVSFNFSRQSYQLGIGIRPDYQVMVHAY